jgi:hypothetical protein
MKWSSRNLVWLALVLLLTGLVMGAVGCQRNPLDETPPFKGPTWVGIAPSWLYDAYGADEANADKACKGKLLVLDTSPGTGAPEEVEGLEDWGRPILVDSVGEKYVAGTVADPKAASGKREVIRCYLYRPENPLVVTAPPPEGAMGGHTKVDIIGICIGKVDRMIVLRKCYYYSYQTGFLNW